MGVGSEWMKDINRRLALTVSFFSDSDSPALVEEWHSYPVAPYVFSPSSLYEEPIACSGACS